MAFTIYYCWNNDKTQVAYEEHYNYYENWISNIENDKHSVGTIEVDKQSHEAWLDLGDMYYGVLVTVCVCDNNGAIYDDLCTLFERDGFSRYEDALRCYHSINLTTDQQVVLWLYLRNRIAADEGMYLSYEIVDIDGNSEWEAEPFFFDPEWVKDKYGITV